MIRCNRGILLGETIRWPRFCRLDPGHRGQHECVYLGEVIRFDAPPRYRSDGTRADLPHEQTARVPVEGSRPSEAQRGTQR